MSRSGYSDDIDDLWASIRWSGAVKSAIRGKRGQAFLREMLAQLDAMEDKRLVAYQIVGPKGECCALGCVAKARGIDVSDLNPPMDEMGRVDKYEIDDEDTDVLAARLGISRSMAREIVYLNDEWGDNSPEQRWHRMRAWVVSHLS